MPLPLQLCDVGHQAVAFLGDCPLCKYGEYASKRQFSKELSRLTYTTHLDAALKETYGIDRPAQ